MNMDFYDGVSVEKAQRLCKRVNLVVLSQVIDYITVKEIFIVSHRRKYIVHISLYQAEEYIKEYNIKPSEVLAVFGSRFPTALKKEIQSELKKMAIHLRLHLKDIGKSSASALGSKDEEENRGDISETLNQQNSETASEIGDGGAYDKKRIRQRNEEISYDSDDTGLKDATEYAEEDIEVSYEDQDESVNLLKDQSESLNIYAKHIEELFMKNISWATSFRFSDIGASFQLEVPFFVVSLL